MSLPPADSNLDPTSTSEVHLPEPGDDVSAPDPAPVEEGKKGKTKKKKKKGQGKVGTSRGIETMFRTSYNTHVNLSGMADSKANIMISINGIIMSIIIASISPKIAVDPLLLIPSSVLLIGCLVSIVYAVLAARPRVNRSTITLDDVRRQGANILFFGQFSSLKLSDFEEGMEDLLRNTDDIYHQMIRDLYSLGQVLSRKFELLRISYTVFMFGLIGGVTLFIIIYLMAVLSPPV